MRDLFGEIPVTWPEVEMWVAAIAPNFASSDRSLQHYARNWDVPSKIRAAKLAGTFDQALDTARGRRAALARRLGLPLA